MISTTAKISAREMRQRVRAQRASYPLANAPLQRIHEVVTESLTLSVRGILGGPYAEHDRRCLRHYESILGTCEAET